MTFCMPNKKERIPGIPEGFREVSDEEMPRWTPAGWKEGRLEIHIDPLRVKSLQAFAKIFGKPATIYYPCSSSDISPSEAFPQSKVKYVDTDPEAISLLQRNGFDAEEADATYTRFAEQFDLALMYSVGFQFWRLPAAAVIREVRDKGHIICNTGYGAYRELYEHSNAILVAAHKDDPSTSEPTWDIENVEDYFQYVETDEEFRRQDPQLFTIAKRVTRGIRGLFVNRTDVLKRYVDYLKNSRLWEQNLELEKGSAKHQYSLPPTKKISTEFVFRRDLRGVTHSP